MSGIERLANFIKAREAVRFNQMLGKPKPWTDDPILQQYRFCNVHREDDTVTRWIADNWRDGTQDNWFAMLVARWINWPDTLAEIGYPVVGKPPKYNATNVERVLKARKAEGEKVWTGAYMIGTQGNAVDKAKYVTENVLNLVWRHRTELRPRKGDTLASFAERVRAMPGQGGFMVGQMVADAKYCDPILLAATDWGSWAISGPGSRRGLNRVLNQPVDKPWREDLWLASLTSIAGMLEGHGIKRDRGHGTKRGMSPKGTLTLHAQDLQNCLCEFDKYERVRLGEGRPRSRYNGTN